MNFRLHGSRACAADRRSGDLLTGFADHEGPPCAAISRGQAPYRLVERTMLAPVGPVRFT